MGGERQGLGEARGWEKGIILLDQAWPAFPRLPASLQSQAYYKWLSDDFRI